MSIDLNQFRFACENCPEPVLFFDMSVRSSLISMNLEVIQSKKSHLIEVRKAKKKMKNYQQMVEIIFQAATRFGVSNKADFNSWYTWWLDYFYTLTQDEQDRIKSDYLNHNPEDNWGRPSGSWH